MHTKYQYFRKKKYIIYCIMCFFFIYFVHGGDAKKPVLIWSAVVNLSFKYLFMHKLSYKILIFSPPFFVCQFCDTIIFFVCKRFKIQFLNKFKMKF